MTTEPDTAMITVPELAKRLRVSGPTVRKLITDGKLRALRVGRQWRIPATEVERFLAAHGSAPSA